MVQNSRRCLKMAPKMFQEVPKSPQDGSKWPGALLGGPEEANTLPTPKENQLCLQCRPLASDGHPRPLDGPKMAQEGSKRTPRRP